MNRLDTEMGKFKVLSRGFTLVEILIVIVVIGILAALSLVVYSNISERAMRAAALTELAQLRNGIMVAQTKTGLSIRDLAAKSPAVWDGLKHYDGSPSYGVDYPCPPDMTGIKMSDTSNHCVMSYLRFLDRLKPYVGDGFESLKKGDPWGRPYVIDDEEDGSLIENCISIDRISSAGPDGWRADWNRETNSWWKVVTYPEDYDGIILTVQRVKDRPDDC